MYVGVYGVFVYVYVDVVVEFLGCVVGECVCDWCVDGCVVVGCIVDGWWVVV